MVIRENEDEDSFIHRNEDIERKSQKSQKYEVAETIEVEEQKSVVIE